MNWSEGCVTCHISISTPAGEREVSVPVSKGDGGISVDLIDKKSRKADAHVTLAATSVITVLLSTCYREGAIDKKR